MFEKVTPEKAGISSKKVMAFIDYLERRGLVMHDLIMMRGDKIFAEYYYKPFYRDFNHRQYSQTKSFVSIAIGLLIEEGKLNLDDKIASHFPEKLDSELHPFLKEQTVEDMLKMETTASYPNWFTSGDPDRVHLYFNHGARCHPSGTFYWYDSNGSQVLCSLVEKLSGKKLLEYLKEKLFNKMGCFENAEILKTPNGDSWGDSALLCTPRDMLSFARFVMNYGTWNGERLMNEAYLKKATSKIVDNNLEGFDTATSYGYGYQIWQTENGFGFMGMGGQDTVCVPEKDLILVYNGDNQGYNHARDLTINAFYDYIVNDMADIELPEDIEAENALAERTKNLELYYLKGACTSPFKDNINGKVFETEENRMGIKNFSISFNSETEGVFKYENKQGKKEIKFGIGKNLFGKFPEFGYSDGVGAVRTTDGFTYNCAASLVWAEEKKLKLKVQIIDRYFGNFTATFAYKTVNDKLTCSLNMVKTAEDFLDAYTGTAFATEKQ